MLLRSEATQIAPGIADTDSSGDRVILTRGEPKKHAARVLLRALPPLARRNLALLVGAPNQ